MKMSRLSLLAALALMACDKLPNYPPMGAPAEMNASATNMTTFVVTIESPMGSPSPLSPGLYVIHRDGKPLFTQGMPDNNQGLAKIAEDADPSMLAMNITGAQIFDTPQGDTMKGPATPGKKYVFEFKAQPGDRLSFATMFGESNDAFYAPMDTGLPLFNGNQPIMGDVTAQISLWDGGTEVNEMPGTGPNQAPRQAEPGLGTPENRPIVPISERQDGFTYGQALRVTLSAQ
ncbi:MAG: spondin domain-containing protein [Candidatus Sericytochromatia bacterium]